MNDTRSQSALGSKHLLSGFHAFGGYLLACLLAVIPCLGAKSPNIVFILADDWGWQDLSCHGHPYVQTPNLDRLAREGTDFHRFTVASGVCSPSRTAFLTGNFPAIHNIDGHFAWVEQNQRRNMPDWLDPSTPTLPRLLKEAGYATAHFGKWHLSNDMIPDSPLPGDYGFDEFGAYNCAGEQMPFHEDATRAGDFIARSAREQKPFFVQVWLHEPHTPFHTLPRYEWRFRHLERREDQIYASVLSHADERIGHILDTLDQLNLAQETLVIFSSDNGPARAVKPTPLNLQYDTATGAGWGIAASKGLTGGRRGYKSSLFEGGVGVPFIVRWPGVVQAGGVDRDSIISAVDLMPTLLELAEVPSRDELKIDGINMLEIWKGVTQPNRAKSLFWKFPSPWPPTLNRPDHWVSWAMVREHYKLVANQDFTHFALFDLARDPLETEDLFNRLPELGASMTQVLKTWKTSLPTQPKGQVFSSLRQKDKLP